ncbi:peroxiredoxin [Kocuria atrinae]|uniref:peroxiredoxin n=1 Tax=Kocuria atrinae TaxID=592377 RepID=UPI00031EB856|nr:peroxiredoxin [Kocuria atrinae]
MTSVGSPAPDFTLPNQRGEAVTLSQFQGSPVVLIFFPFAFSPVCTSELCYLQDHPEVFEKSNAKVLGISTDSYFTLDAFARQESYDFELLSDFWPHGEVSRRYGVLAEDGGYANRQTVVLDSQGTIVDAFESDVMEPRQLERFEQALAKLEQY